MLTRKQILAQVSTYDILKHFLKDYYVGEPIKPGVHVYVPEISGKQKTPSFNIYYSHKSNEYRYKDFTGNDGSAFDLVMNLYGLSFKEALKVIDKEMNLNLLNEDVKYSRKDVIPKREPVIEPERNYSFTLEQARWTEYNLQFWTKYGTGLETLRKYHIVPVERLSAFNRGNVPYEIKSFKKRLIYAILGDGWAKYYIPEIAGLQKKRFGYVGKKPTDFVFGLEQLPETGDNLYLVAGEKDTVNMRSHGLNAVCLGSEESAPQNYPSFMALLDSNRFKNYFILYDNDPTGRKRMKEINKDIPKLKPKLLNIPDGWDISDYLMSKYNKLMY